MIITHTTENKPVLSNTGEVGAFTIRSSPKAFSILSSGLYKNKIRAIIRELSCNAVDSHRAAGNREQPFEIHVVYGGFLSLICYCPVGCWLVTSLLPVTLTRQLHPQTGLIPASSNIFL
jgi:hypothetical protein